MLERGQITFLGLLAAGCAVACTPGTARTPMRNTAESQDAAQATPAPKTGHPAKDDPSKTCEPYRCKDGTEIPRCDQKGRVLLYFVNPCAEHGGEKTP